MHRGEFEVMVSFHKPLAEKARAAEFEASSKKRKWEDDPLAAEFFMDQTEAEKRKSSMFDLSSSNNWLTYPSIQSGLCKTSMNMNQPEGQEKSHGSPSASQMSLDLELNLTCDKSQWKKEEDDKIKEKQNSSLPASLSGHDVYGRGSESSKVKEEDSGDLNGSSLSWLSSSEENHREMVATVCMRCHMLVMLCKPSLACPNCKFIHPPDQNPSMFLKRKCSLLC